MSGRPRHIGLFYRIATRNFTRAACFTRSSPKRRTEDRRQGTFCTANCRERVLSKLPERDLPAAVMEFAKVFRHLNWTWKDIDFLRDNTSLPIVLKGILHPDDARKAVKVRCCRFDGHSFRLVNRYAKKQRRELCQKRRA